MSGTQSVSGDPYSLKTRSKWQVAQNIVTGKSSNTIQRMLFRKMLDLRLKCHRFCLGSVRPVYDLILVPRVIKLKPVSWPPTACLATEKVPDVSLKSKRN